MATTDTAAAPLVKIPFYRTVPRLAGDPLRAFEQIGRECDGRLARLGLGLIRPYLATHPDHVQHILRSSSSYLREGMMWKPLRRLEGDGIAGEGPSWRSSRRILQPLFTARHIGTLLDPMADAVGEALDALAGKARPGRPLDLVTEMTSMMHRVLIRVFFGDRIAFDDADRLGEAIATAFQQLGWRMLLPFVADPVPLPGDRAFRRAVATVDGLIYPLIQASRAGRAAAGAGAGAPGAGTGSGGDLVDLLTGTVDEEGRLLDDKRVRDDLVAMFVAGTETTALTLTWLWLLLDRHPQVAQRLAAEAREAVGAGPARPEHLAALGYTRMSLQEALRLYPVGWVIPRTVVERDTVAGTVLRPGATVLLSPYLTHRLPAFWDDPYAFRPDRFAPAQAKGRHRFAYFPFGAGAHQCLGNHFFLLEGQLAVAGLLARFRPEVVGAGSLQARAGAVLRPRGSPQLLLHPRR